jgi:hypothetical protein
MLDTWLCDWQLPEQAPAITVTDGPLEVQDTAIGWLPVNENPLTLAA